MTTNKTQATTTQKVRHEIIGSKGYDLLSPTISYVSLNSKDVLMLQSNVYEVKSLLEDKIDITISFNAVKIATLTISDLKCTYIFLPVKNGSRYEKIKAIVPTLKDTLRKNIDDIKLSSPNIGFVTDLWLQSELKKDNEKSMNIEFSEIDTDDFIDCLDSTEKLLKDNNISYPIQFKKLINYINTL